MYARAGPTYLDSNGLDKWRPAVIMLRFLRTVGGQSTLYLASAYSN